MQIINEIPIFHYRESVYVNLMQKPSLEKVYITFFCLFLSASALFSNGTGRKATEITIVLIVIFFTFIVCC